MFRADLALVRQRKGQRCLLGRRYEQVQHLRRRKVRLHHQRTFYLRKISYLSCLISCSIWLLLVPEQSRFPIRRRFNETVWRRRRPSRALSTKSNIHNFTIVIMKSF